MKVFYFSLLCLMLSSCGGFNYKSNLSMPYQTSKNVILKDVRPKEQKTQAIMSLSLFSCKYGSYQIGDDSQSPTRTEFLENYLSYHHGNELKDKEIKLRNFTIHVNAAAQLRGGLSNMYGGAISYAIIQEKKVGCSGDDLFGGYTVGELTDKYPPIIAVVDLEIDNKIYHARALRSIEGEKWGVANPKWDEVVQDLMLKVSKSIVDKISKNEFVTL